MTDTYRVVFFVGLVGALFLSVAIGTVGAQSAPDCSTANYDGSGTSDDPYEVGDIDQLQCIGNEETETELNDSYLQTDDIDASATGDWNKKDEFTEGLSNSLGGSEGEQFKLAYSPVDELLDTDGVEVELVDSEEGIIELREETDGGFDVTYRVEEEIPVGFDPIGERSSPTEDTEFTGTFDGSGNTITGLTIDRSAEADIGLFGRTNLGAEITNVGIEAVEITGDGNIGGLVGGSSGTVNGSYVTGEVSGDGNVGGLIGFNDGTVVESYAAGDVSEKNRVGGLVGLNYGTVTASYATGDVSGDSNVGGLVGRNNGGTVTASYATGDVSGDRWVGGLIGVIGFQNGGTVKESYATGEVTGDDDVGGLVGGNSDGTIKESYWDTEATGQDESDGGTGLTASEMTGSAVQDNMQGFDFTETWVTVTDPDGYPVLVWQLNEDSAQQTGENGEESDEGEGLPGFGVVAAVIAVVAVTYLRNRKGDR